MPGVDVVLVTDQAQMTQIGDLVNGRYRDLCVIALEARIGAAA